MTCWPSPCTPLSASCSICTASTTLSILPNTASTRCRYRPANPSSLTVKADLQAPAGIVDGRDPFVVCQPARIHVVNSVTEKARLLAFQDRPVSHLLLAVGGGRQFGNLEGVYLNAIIRKGVLGEAVVAAIHLNDSPGWSRNMRISFDNRASRMLAPWAGQVVGEMQAKRAALVGGGFRKHPPHPGVAEDRRVSMPALQQLGLECPT